MAEAADDFLKTCSNDQPFFLEVGFKTPHIDDNGDAIMGHFVPEPEVLATYGNQTFPRAHSANAAAFHKLPKFLQTSEARRRWLDEFENESVYQDSVRKYYALITGMDIAIGRIRKSLEDYGFADNTIIVFGSDNGFFLGEHGLSGKWYGYEESIRVPLVIRPLRRPAISDVYDMTLNIDLAPTFLAMAGMPAPEVMQGRSLLPLWGGGAHESLHWRKDFLYEHLFNISIDKLPKNWPYLGIPPNEYSGIPSSVGVRTEQYKYLHYTHELENGEMLFDLKADPYEENNIIKTAPKNLVRELRERTKTLIAEAGR
jgi:arylsulfatase A-like enzyme